MDFLYLFFLLAVFLFLYIYFSIPCAQKYQRIKKLIDLESFETAYELIGELSRSNYGILVQYPETLLADRAFCLLNLSRYQEAIAVYDHIIKKIEQAPGTNNKCDCLKNPEIADKIMNDYQLKNLEPL